MPVPDYAVRMLRALPERAVFVSPRGRILVANEAAREALRLSAECPVDCEMGAFVEDPPDKLAATLRSWSTSTNPTPGSFMVTIAGAQATFNAKGSVVIPRADDTPAVLLVRFWPREEANPFVLLSQKIIELNDEVTRRVQVEEALRRSEAALRERADEAEALNRAKDEFLATVSHELRTPLNAILGWASLLAGRAADAQVGKGLDVIRRNAESQAKLIDDILDVSRIITGKLLLETKPSDLAAIVGEAIEVVRPSAAAKQIELTVAHPADVCVMIADPDRLRQVVWNLLSNAVKFTGRGGSVRVDVERRGSHLAVIVADTGDGIEPAFLPFVFDRFKQADGSTTRRAGGLGLGLAIVRHIVELHGGSAEVHSDGRGKGAVFTVMLPVRAVVPAVVAEGDPGASAPASTAPRDETLRGFRILVVDDEPDARELLTTVLELAGAQVKTAGSVSEAFDMLAGFRPDVLVSDIGLPDEDGYSFISRIRRLGPADGGAIPSVALTAYTQAADRTKALAAGFTTHLGKPVVPEDLVSAVANLALFARR